MADGVRVAAVTGAASGIGRATALALSASGLRVALCDRNAAAVGALAQSMQGAGGQVRAIVLDISDQGEASRAIDAIAEGWGRLDVLVNAAGISSSGPSSRGPVLGITEQDWDRIIDVNLLGTVYCAQAAARHYHQVDASRLDPMAAAQLAVLLPAPKRFERNPGSAYVSGRAATIAARMGDVELP